MVLGSKISPLVIYLCLPRHDIVGRAVQILKSCVKASACYARGIRLSNHIPRHFSFR
jgi:hypothetical protein